MKIIRHQSKFKSEECARIFCDPLIIWLTRSVELRIERGDRLRTVAHAIGLELHLLKKDALRLAAFYFALGERARRHRYPAWNNRELRVTPGRRYLTS